MVHHVQDPELSFEMMNTPLSLCLMISPILPEMACRTNTNSQADSPTGARFPTMVHRSIHLLLLVDAEGARAHVDQ